MWHAALQSTNIASRARNVVTHVTLSRSEAYLLCRDTSPTIMCLDNNHFRPPFCTNSQLYFGRFTSIYIFLHIFKRVRISLLRCRRFLAFPPLTPLIIDHTFYTSTRHCHTSHPSHHHVAPMQCISSSLNGKVIIEMPKLGPHSSCHMTVFGQYVKSSKL